LGRRSGFLALPGMINKGWATTATTATATATATAGWGKDCIPTHVTVKLCHGWGTLDLWLGGDLRTNTKIRTKTRTRTKARAKADSSASLRNDKQKGFGRENGGKDKIRGSFDCAIHDEAVNRFAQDDGDFAAENGLMGLVWVCKPVLAGEWIG
jgi:hypothetical protein